MFWLSKTRDLYDFDDDFIMYNHTYVLSML